MPRTPDYQRIMEDLRRRIAAGEWKVGEQLPTQGQLAEQYRVSLQPVKAALLRMELAGEIYSQQGKGAFVAEQSSS